MLTDKTMNSELSADSQVLLLRKKQRTFKSFMKRNWRGYLFLAPFVILFTTFIIIPVICAMVLSFTNYNMLQDATFVGFNNYKLLFLDDDIFIILKDNGYGLSSDETSHIFELNYQGSNRISGNGLGLTQAKAIVNYYGGTIYARSTKGNGMGIYIQLPTNEVTGGGE